MSKGFNGSYGCFHSFSKVFLDCLSIILLVFQQEFKGVLMKCWEYFREVSSFYQKIQSLTWRLDGWFTWYKANSDQLRLSLFICEVGSLGNAKLLPARLFPCLPCLKGLPYSLLLRDV